MQAPLYDKLEECQFIWLSEGSLENDFEMIENNPGSRPTYNHQLD